MPACSERGTAENSDLRVPGSLLAQATLCRGWRRGAWEGVEVSAELRGLAGLSSTGEGARTH